MSDLPPLDQPQAHVVVGPDDQRGPYTLELLISEVVAGRLHEQTPVWWPGLPDWTTMAAQPAVAAEIARRRAPSPTAAPSPFASPAPAPAASGLPQSAAEAPPVEVVPGDVTPADFAAVDDSPAVYDAAGPAEGLDPEHGEAFADLVRRSRARADAAAIVASIDDGFADAVAAAAASQGLEAVASNDDGEVHERSFRADDSTSVVVRTSKVTGHAMAVRDGHVDLDVTARSTSFSGMPSSPADGGETSAAHGEILVESSPGGGGEARVSLMLPLADYVSESMEVDRRALERDLAAVLVSVRNSLA